MENKEEIWKDISGYEGYYQVSNLGRIKSLDRKEWMSINNCFKIRKGRILKQTSDKDGYLFVTLSKNSISNTAKIHQYVAIAFLGHKPDGFKIVVDHINHNKKDNRLKNLRLITSRENTTFDHIPSTSKYVGVFLSGKKWRASIVYNGKHCNIGSFKEEEDAAKAYKEALELVKQNKSLYPLKEKYKAKYSSKYKGVCYVKGQNKWKAYLFKGKWTKHIGYYKTEYEAHIAYQNALKKERFKEQDPLVNICLFSKRDNNGNGIIDQIKPVNIVDKLDK